MQEIELFLHRKINTTVIDINACIFFQIILPIIRCILPRMKSTKFVSEFLSRRIRIFIQNKFAKINSAIAKKICQSLPVLRFDLQVNAS